MSILIDGNTRVVTQGITGKTGQFHTKMGLEYANGRNCYVAGVNPKKPGEKFEGVPIFATVKEAKKETGANVSVIYVPPPFAAAAIDEAVEADLDLVICITEGIPVRDMIRTRYKMQGKKTVLVGPNCPGVIGRASIMDCIEPGGIGGTYGGSPVGCAAALAVLDVIEEEGLLERAEVIGAAIRAHLGRIAGAEHIVPIANVRGLGAMVAFDVVKDAASREPDAAGARAVAARALERGLIVLTCGTYGETVRILVPLTIQYDVLEQGLAMLERALRPPYQPKG
jgi:hypothetical protein